MLTYETTIAEKKFVMCHDSRRFESTYEGSHPSGAMLRIHWTPRGTRPFDV